VTAVLPARGVLQPLRYRWWWLAAGLAGLAAILALALLPVGGGLPFVLDDKLAHAMGFAVLMLWFSGVLEPRVAPQLAVGLLAYGVLIEILQALTSYRSAEAYDVLSDAIGISAGWLLAFAGLRRWCGRVEAFLGATPR
jgi:VanZ family protein